MKNVSTKTKDGVENTGLVLFKTYFVRIKDDKFRRKQYFDFNVLRKFDLRGEAMIQVVRDLLTLIWKTFDENNIPTDSEPIKSRKYFVGDIKEDMVELIKAEAGKDKEGKFIPLFSISFSVLEKFGFPELVMVQFAKSIGITVKEGIQEYIDGQRKYFDDYQKKLDKVWS